MDPSRGHPAAALGAPDAEPASEWVSERPAGGAPPALLADVQANARRFEFDQLLWLLTRALGPDALRTGRLRVAPRTNPAFPASDVERVEVGEDERVAVEVTFMGLYGPSAPLPRYFTEPIAAGEADALRALLDLFSGRTYALYHEAWRKYRPRYRFKAAPDGAADAAAPDAAPFVALMGIPPGSDGTGLPVAPLRLAALAGRLGARARTAAGLRDLLAYFLGHPVEIQENHPRWVTAPSRGRLGAGGDGALRIGLGALLGGRVYDVSGKVRVVVGPLDLDDFRSLLPSGARAPLAAGLIGFYLPDGLGYDVELRLRAPQAHRLLLGDNHSRLGRNAWVGQTGAGLLSEVVAYA